MEFIVTCDTKMQYIRPLVLIIIIRLSLQWVDFYVNGKIKKEPEKP